MADSAPTGARDLVTRRGQVGSKESSSADLFSGDTLTGLPPIQANPDGTPSGPYLFMKQAPAPDEALDPRLYASKGKAYSASQLVQRSHYNDDIGHPDGGPSGSSRLAGDATPDTQRRAMQAIVSAGRNTGMTDGEIALTLAIARHESGFNPDAAAGTTSASGLGQFTDQTGAHYGLDSNNRWDVGAQASALVQHTLDNMHRARDNGHDGSDLDRYTYAYHHAGPSLKYGGLGIADKSVVPLVDLYRGSVGTLGSQDER